MHCNGRNLGSDVAIKFVTTTAGLRQELQSMESVVYANPDTAVNEEPEPPGWGKHISSSTQPGVCEIANWYLSASENSYILD